MGTVPTMGDDIDDPVVYQPKLRLLDPNYFTQLFNTDDHETQTSFDQTEVEKLIIACCEEAKKLSKLDPTYPSLQRDVQVQFLKKGLGIIPSIFSTLDSSRPWLCYWIVHSLELLDERISEDSKTNMITFLSLCQDPNGGFAGGPGQEAHLAATYAAVSTLCILKSVEAYDIINRKKLLAFLLKMKQPDGSYILHASSEVDIRGTYCALTVARLTNLWIPELFENTAQWVASCQTYEGGFGGVPYMEAHGGYTFCGFASLVLLNKENMCNIPSLLRWLVNRQMRLEGGFQGRTNKLVDSCYSFWQGSIFPLLHRILTKTENETMSTSSWLFDHAALQEYILVCCEAIGGGMIDKPGKNRDFYHTCYALSGLSIAQHFAGGHIGKTIVLGDIINELCPTHPIYNISFDAAIEASHYFASLPLPDYTIPSTSPKPTNCRTEK